MFDISLRPLKDGVFDPICKYMPAFVSPLHVTGLAFGFGLLSCYSISLTHANKTLSLLFWILNRSLDCLDGALARHRGTASDLGGFLDLLGDFIIYSLLPIAIARASPPENGSSLWISVAVLEATIHVNNFVLFYVAAIAEKSSNAAGSGKAKRKELTSVMMRPALIEGVESGLIFTAMLVYPSAIQSLSWTMAGLVTVGIIQRTLWVIQALTK
ncbi:MAG: hypothetical protein L6R41_002065 [Letrouitia leprolyta]|nr:MAG: hypothetical protein L6R41_002065 [Letrouitia leprolyta]